MKQTKLLALVGILVLFSFSCGILQESSPPPSVATPPPPSNPTPPPALVSIEDGEPRSVLGVQITWSVDNPWRLYFPASVKVDPTGSRNRASVYRLEVGEEKWAWLWVGGYKLYSHSADKAEVYYTTSPPE